MEIYLPTAGINLQMYHGTMIGPVFGDILLRGLSSRLEEKVRGRMLFNCHSPVFIKDHSETEIGNLVEERAKEIKRLRLHNNWQFERDDKIEEKLEPYIDMLFSEEIFYIDNEDILFNISKLKRGVKKKGDKIKVIPEYYEDEFRKYLKSKTPPQSIRGKLKYGFNLKKFGANIILNQVWEQAIFPALSEDNKIILSGPNVLGPYSFRAAMLCAYSGDSDIYLTIHSLAKVADSLKSRLGERGRLPIDYIIESCSGIVDTPDFLRYMATLPINDRKIITLDENSLTKARKALVKYYNLRKVLDREEPEKKQGSIEDYIKTIYCISDKFFRDVHLVSQAYSKKEEITLWKNCVRDAELIIGRTI